MRKLLRRFVFWALGLSTTYGGDIRVHPSPMLEDEREYWRVNQCIRAPGHSGPCNGWERPDCHQHPTGR